MNGLRRKGGYANSNVFGTVRIGAAILDPFSSVGNDGFSGPDVKFLLLRLDVKRPSQDESIFVKFRNLSGLKPATGTSHPRNAHGLRLRVDPSDKFFNDLGLVSRGLNNGRSLDKSWHGIFL